MRAAISTRRIVSIFCLLLTLVISLFISNYYFADDSVLEGLTVEGLSPSVAQKMDTTEDSKKGSLDSKMASGDSKNTTVDSKNSTVDSKKTTGDTKKTTGDTKMVSGDTKMASGDSKNTTVDSKKTTGDSKMASGDSKNTTVDSKKTTGDSKKGSLDSKKADDNTDIMEDFQLQYEDVSNETHIRTTPDKQPPMPSRNNTLGVFNHVFGMSNPNEQFVIPRI